MNRDFLNAVTAAAWFAVILIFAAAGLGLLRP